MALVICVTLRLKSLQANGSRIISFNYQGHTIISGKPKLDKLPATYVESPDEATTLLITLYDNIIVQKLF